MGDAWMPGAGRFQASADGGQLGGGAPRVVWQTLETDPRLVSARSAAQCLDQLGRPPHLVWNPLNGEIVQLIPVLRAGRWLGGPDGLIAADRPCQGEAAAINREGRLCIQLAVVSFAREPFTAGPMTDLELIIWWLDTWRIPRSWPAAGRSLSRVRMTGRAVGARGRAAATLAARRCLDASRPVPARSKSSTSQTRVRYRRSQCRGTQGRSPCHAGRR